MITNSFPPRGLAAPVFGAVLLSLSVPFLSTWMLSSFEYQAWKNFDSKPDLPRLYLPTYAATGIRCFLRPRHTQPTNQSYQVFTLSGNIATPESFIHPRQGIQYQSVLLEPGKLHEWLRRSVYQGQRLSEIFFAPLVLFYLALPCLVTLAMSWSIRQRARARAGLHIRGTRLVGIGEFNRETRRNSPREFRGQVGLWFPVGRFGKKIIIPQWLLSYNICIFGSIGTGKSTLIRWILKQVEARGWLAIVYDPKREFAAEFYLKDRGDWLLDPTLKDCPYWAMETEAQSEGEATPWAMAFWPDEPHQQPFFKKHPRAIFSYLLSRYSVYNEPENPATCASLGYWLADPRARVAPLLVGTEHAVAVDAAAKDQSQGLWTTLGEIAKPLRMMPQTPEGRRTFSVKSWSEKPEGWIFMTSEPDTVDAVLPLHSALLDMLLVKNQKPQENNRKPIFFVIDEVATLQRLPQLESAAAKQRGSGNPIILGIQASTQLNTRYGADGAKTIMSQATTNFILRTGDPDVSKHASGLIGKHEVKRYQESRPAGGLFGGKKTWSEQQQETPVVMDAEIQGLRPFTGYLSQTGKAVFIRVKKLPKHLRITHFEERVIPQLVSREEPAPNPEPYCEAVASLDPLLEEPVTLHSVPLPVIPEETPKPKRQRAAKPKPEQPKEEVNA